MVPRRAYTKTLDDNTADEITVPGVEIASPSTPRARRRGRPTGLDGRAKRPGFAVQSLQRVLGQEIMERGWNRDLATGWVTGNWATLVGDNIAAHTSIEMVKETTLFISCDSTAWAANLRYMQSTILSEIAKKVGPNVITELKIFGPQAPSWRKGRLHVKGRGPRDTYG